MKTIITSLLLLFCLSVNSQSEWKPLKLTAHSTMYSNDSILEKHLREKHIADSIYKKMLYDRFMSIPQSEINLGLHKFKEQHRTGNHLIITGIVATTLGSLLMVSSTKSSQGVYGNSSSGDSYPAGVFFTAIGGGLTTAGFIINIDSFRHLK